MLQDWLLNVLRNVLGNILIIQTRIRRIENNLEDQIALVGRLVVNNYGFMLFQNCCRLCRL
jgi:hypothetical protein